MAYQKSKNKPQSKKLMTVVRQSIPMLSLCLTTACMVESEVTQPSDMNLQTNKIYDSNPLPTAYDLSLDQYPEISYDGNSFPSAYDLTVDQNSHPLDMSVDQSLSDDQNLSDADVFSLDQGMGNKK